MKSPHFVQAWLGNQLAQPNLLSDSPRARPFIPYVRVNRRSGDRLGRIVHRAHQN